MNGKQRRNPEGGDGSVKPDTPVDADSETSGSTIQPVPDVVPEQTEQPPTLEEQIYALGELESGKERKNEALRILNLPERREASNIREIADQAFHNIETKSLIDDYLRLREMLHSTVIPALKEPAPINSIEMAKLRPGSPWDNNRKPDERNTGRLEKLDTDQEKIIKQSLGRLTELLGKDTLTILFSDAPAELYEMDSYSDDLEKTFIKYVKSEFASSNLGDAVQAAKRLLFTLERTHAILNGIIHHKILDPLDIKYNKVISTQTKQILAVKGLVNILESMASKCGRHYEHVYPGQPYLRETQIPEGMSSNDLNERAFGNYEHFSGGNGVGDVAHFGHRDTDPETGELMPTEESFRSRIRLVNTRGQN